jgi:hypothetical protein
MYRQDASPSKSIVAAKTFSVSNSACRLACVSSRPPENAKHGARYHLFWVDLQRFEEDPPRIRKTLTLPLSDPYCFSTSFKHSTDNK